jgi:hypothetical protein
MDRPPGDRTAREAAVIAALRDELSGLDDETRRALARALERDDLQLQGGSWGTREDGAGCLLSLAAWDLGLPDGEALMARSIAAVRVPVLFDELWRLVLDRTGDAAQARRVAHRLVALAINREAERRDRVAEPSA